MSQLIIAAFMMGLLGSFHCVGMCGPIALSLPLKDPSAWGKFSGALFYLVPMAWFYFGQTVREDFMPKIMRLIVILGVIASLHGVYQLVFGYPYFEKYCVYFASKIGLPMAAAALRSERVPL